MSVLFLENNMMQKQKRIAQSPFSIGEESLNAIVSENITLASRTASGESFEKGLFIVVPRLSRQVVSVSQ